MLFLSYSEAFLTQQHDLVKMRTTHVLWDLPRVQGINIPLVIRSSDSGKNLNR